MNINGVEIPILAPEDIILLKALMQRTQDKDRPKHDEADIMALIRHQTIDWEYIGCRVKELQAEERILPYLLSLIDKMQGITIPLII